MGLAAALLLAILVIIIIIGIWVVMNHITEFQINIAHGQTNVSTNVTKTTPTPQVVVSPPTNVATLPNPNWQFLPQKAYVQSFAPEVQPNTPTAIVGPLPASAPTTITQQPVAAAAPSAAGSLGGLDLGSIMAMIISTGSGIYTKMTADKTKKVEATSQANAGAIVDTKVVQQEIARYMFNLDKAKADALNDSPAIKLENLEKEKKEATETAAKA